MRRDVLETGGGGVASSAHLKRGRRGRPRPPSLQPLVRFFPPLPLRFGSFSTRPGPGGFRPSPARRALVTRSRRAGSTGGGAGSGPGERVAELPDRSGEVARGARSRPRARAAGAGAGWLVDPSTSLPPCPWRPGQFVRRAGIAAAAKVRAQLPLLHRSKSPLRAARARLFRPACCSVRVAAGLSQPIFIFLSKTQTTML